MRDPNVERFEIIDPVHGRVPCLATWPGAAGAGLPLCLFLYGGGGSQETLAAIAPALAAGWRSGELPPLLIACAGVPPFCFYLDDPARGSAYETLVADTLRKAACSRFIAPGSPAASTLVGISMGGYGALKIALARPDVFRAVAAVSPMVEPFADGGQVPLRNRFAYPPEVPQALLGPARERALYERDHPAARARRHAGAVRSHGLGIYLDAASRDALCAHDGCESLHRVLWELDLVHEYHLLRDANHVGPSVAPRLLRAFAWVAEQASTPENPEPSPEERALAQLLAPARARAAQLDDTLDRTYGRL